MPIQIKTNNVPRDLVSLADLPPDAAKDFDYIDGEGRYSPRLFRYRGSWYDANEFLSPIPNRGGFSAGLPDDHPLRAWDGHQSDTYWSGVCLRYANEFESVIVGRWFEVSDTFNGE